MSNETCETCKFWQEIENRKVGDCRKYSPKKVPTKTGSPSQWPMTSPTSWCGEYETQKGTPRAPIFA